MLPPHRWQQRGDEGHAGNGSVPPPPTPLRGGGGSETGHGAQGVTRRGGGDAAPWQNAMKERETRKGGIRAGAAQHHQQERAGNLGGGCTESSPPPPNGQNQPQGPTAKGRNAKISPPPRAAWVPRMGSNGNSSTRGEEEKGGFVCNRENGQQPFQGAHILGAGGMWGGGRIPSSSAGRQQRPPPPPPRGKGPQHSLQREERRADDAWLPKLRLLEGWGGMEGGGGDGRRGGSNESANLGFRPAEGRSHGSAWLTAL